MAEDRAAVQVSTRRFILASSDSEGSDVEGKSEQGDYQSMCRVSM